MTFINKHSLFLMLIVSQFTLSFAQGKLMIIGGGKRPPELIQRLISESGVDKQGYIVILPMASEEQDSSIFYAKKQFVNAGISKVVGYIINKGDQVSQNVIDSIANANLIYIGGGDQVRFMNIVAGTAIEKAIKQCFSKGNVVSGTSAGAAVMSEKMITGVELNHKATTEDTEKQGFETIEANNIEIAKGLGFLKNAIVDQHFIKRKRQNRLFAVSIENQNTLCVGIDEATAIFVYKGIAEVVGDSQVLTVKSASKKIVSSKSKLGAKNLNLNIYISGDKFKIN